ncbi:MAG: Virginiamycin B lyase [Candidatus Binataceae bacterium]|nr:Virginiamycin B lyase [Candidatus Binataceae bacterium]
MTVQRLHHATAATRPGGRRLSAAAGSIIALVIVALIAGCSSSADKSINALPRITMHRAYISKQQFHAPYALAADSNGNVWFTEYQNNAIGRLTPAGEVLRFALGGPGFPERLAPGADGRIWFTDPVGNRIGRLDPVSAVLTYFTLATPMAGADGIAGGADGAIWFTEHAANRIGRIDRDGAIIEYALPHDGGPGEMIAGRDHDLWFAEDRANAIGSITTAGSIKEFKIPTASSRPGGLAIGSDGTLWFTELAANKVGKISRDGVATDYLLPPRGVPLGIASAADNIWITIAKAHMFYRIGRDGKLQSLKANSDTYPGFIAAGPDQSLWFTEPGGKIGRLTPPASITEFAIPEASEKSTRQVQSSDIAPVSNTRVTQ